MLSVRLSGYGCMQEVERAREKCLSASLALPTPGGYSGVKRIGMTVGSPRKVP